jgi:hypothetical protein
VHIVHSNYMLVFFLGNLPLPLILYLNWNVTVKYWQIHHLSKHAHLKKPKQLIVGWLLSNVSIVFALIPVISERRIFVRNPHWLLFFAISATLTISGLILMDRGLTQELGGLVRNRKRQQSI